MFSFFPDEIIEMLMWRERSDFRATQKLAGQMERESSPSIVWIQVFLPCALFFMVLLKQ